MPSKLVSTGVQFPDGTTQTTAATGGLTKSATSTTIYHNYPNHPYQRQDSQSSITIGEGASTPRVDVYSARYNLNQYGGNPYTNRLELSAGPSVVHNNSNNMPSDNIPYPPTSYSTTFFVRGKGVPTDNGSHRTDAAWRISYHNIT